MRNDICVLQMVYVRLAGIVKVEIVHAHIKFSLYTFLTRVLNRHLGGVVMSFLIMAVQNNLMAPRAKDELSPST